MPETHIMLSSSIFHFTFLLVLRLIFLMDIIIAHMVLVHESGIVPRRFYVNPRFHRGVRPMRRHGFSARGVYSHFEPSCFDGPCFPRCGSCPTRSNGEIQRIVKTSSGRMVKC
jgi:hypothetical protein